MFCAKTFAKMLQTFAKHFCKCFSMFCLFFVLFFVLCFILHVTTVYLEAMFDPAKMFCNIFANVLA